MVELAVRQDELVVTVDPREKRSLTWFGLRKSRSKLLDGLELRVPLAKVVSADTQDAHEGVIRGEQLRPDESSADRLAGVHDDGQVCMVSGQDC